MPRIAPQPSPSSIRAPRASTPQTLTTALRQSNELETLRQGTGLIDRIGASLAGSKAAKSALIDLYRAKAEAERNIGLTNIKSAQAAIQLAVITDSLPRIGALAERLQTSTAVFDQVLSAANTAICLSHGTARKANLALIDARLAEGDSTPEEADQLRKIAYEMALEDMRSGLARVRASKDLVAKLHELALAGLADTAAHLIKDV